MDCPPTLYEQYRYMPQQVPSAVLQAPIGPAQHHPAGYNTGISRGGLGVETSSAHALEGTEPSSPDQGNDRVQTRSPARRNKGPRGNKRPRCEWSDAENEFLIRCKQERIGDGGRRSKGKANCTKWDQIYERFLVEFKDLGQVKTCDQIRQKWDTILKSYNNIKKFLGNKDYSQLEDMDFHDDVKGLDLAIRLTRKWYIMIDQCQVSSQQPNCQTSGLLDSLPYVVSDQSLPTQRQAYNQPQALQSASPGTGGNSPTHSQTTYDNPPFGSSGDACVEITPNNDYRQTENGLRNGVAPAIVMRQSEGQSAPMTFMQLIGYVQATNLADIQYQAPTTQNEANISDHPRLQNSSHDTTYNPLTHSEGNHYRPPSGHTADTAVLFRSGDGHLQAENSQIGRGATLQVMTEDRGQSDQLTIAAPSNDDGPPESTGIQEEAQELGGRRPLEQVAIPYFNSLSEITKSVLLDLIVYDEYTNLRFVCEWLASLHNEDPIDMMASVQELAVHGLLDIKHIYDGCKSPLLWQTSGMWSVILNKERRTYQKFVWSVIRKYPKHQIYLHIRHDGHQDLQRPLQRRLSEGLELFRRRRGGGLVFRTSVQHQHLKDLCLYECTDLLQEVDLRNLPNLRSFTIDKCPKAIVTGWKYVTNLERLRVEDCDLVYPKIKHLSSLKFLHLLDSGMEDSDGHCDWFKSSEGCQLQSLTIGSFPEYGPFEHLAKLEFLQCLTLVACAIPSGTLQALSVLHSLIELSFRLSSFGWCGDPKDTVDLSALRRLSSLDLTATYYFWEDGTHGVEELENLTYLNCRDSDLEHLPDLSGLNKLRWVILEGTPFFENLGSGDLPEWLSKVREETVFSATEWNDSPPSDIFYESESESESESGSDSE